MKRIVVTGASGFIGTRLCDVLRQSGYEVATIGRGPSATFRWDYASDAPPEAFESAEAVVHLAGEPVFQRWSPEVKQRIHDSRVRSTERLIQALSITRDRPKVLVCASAVGYYGNSGDHPLPETAGPGRGFLSDICREWEAKADLAESLGMRVAKIRTGIVLGKNGGALKQMLPAFKAGVGGRLASGTQWMPFIHLDDIVGIYQHAIANPVNGPLNGTAPGIVTNREFTAKLAEALHRPAFLPVPKFALSLLFGEVGEVMLDSLRVIPTATVESGYRFRYPDLPSALASLRL
jgi:uncharacterized protein (TIGR01777 family)